LLETVDDHFAEFRIAIVDDHGLIVLVPGDGEDPREEHSFPRRLITPSCLHAQIGNIGRATLHLDRGTSVVGTE
jgi:hypothetical protein